MDTTSFDLGIAVARVTIGGMLIVHGLNKVRGTGGLAGTIAWFESLGMKPAWLHARVAAATEIGSGALLCLGLLTALGCAAVIGLMVVAAFTDHRGKGFFVFKGGWEYVAVVALIAFVLACVGPGRWSVDHALGIPLGGVGWGVLAAVVGVVVAVLTLVVGRRSTADA